MLLDAAHRYGREQFSAWFAMEKDTRHCILYGEQHFGEYRLAYFVLFMPCARGHQYF